jgi:hypothetical protein
MKLFPDFQSAVFYQLWQSLKIFYKLLSFTVLLFLFLKGGCVGRQPIKTASKRQKNFSNPQNQNLELEKFF